MYNAITDIYDNTNKWYRYPPPFFNFSRKYPFNVTAKYGGNIVCVV